MDSRYKPAQNTGIIIFADSKSKINVKTLCELDRNTTNPQGRELLPDGAHSDGE
jgi:hypothetical protein